MSKAAKVSAIGIDQVCEMICDANSLTVIAAFYGISTGRLVTWIEADPERSVRAREARTLTAQMWDEKAQDGIDLATDPFELAKAKEMAHHFRWRASKIAPKTYGDKVQQEITGADGGPIKFDPTKLSDADLAVMLATMAKAQA